MKLEDQVCSLDLAKRLKELGVKQESAFYWEDSYFHPGNWSLFKSEGEPRMNANVAAFTVAELGKLIGAKLLPCPLSNPEGEVTWMLPESFREPTYPYKESFKTEADARAKMLVYLIEQGIVKP